MDNVFAQLEALIALPFKGVDFLNFFHEGFNPAANYRGLEQALGKDTIFYSVKVSYPMYTKACMHGKHVKIDVFISNNQQEIFSCSCMTFYGVGSTFLSITQQRYEYKQSRNNDNICIWTHDISSNSDNIKPRDVINLLYFLNPT